MSGQERPPGCVTRAPRRVAPARPCDEAHASQQKASAEGGERNDWQCRTLLFFLYLSPRPNRVRGDDRRVGVVSVPAFASLARRNVRDTTRPETPLRSDYSP